MFDLLFHFLNLFLHLNNVIYDIKYIYTFFLIYLNTVEPLCFYFKDSLKIIFFFLTLAEMRTSVSKEM